MPQVAARINTDQERWLKEYFRTKSAGAEFILPWAVDTFFRCITSIKKIFASNELKAVIQAHKDVRLQPDNARLSYLMLRMSDAFELGNIQTRYELSKTSLQSKMKSLNDTQAAALMIWASAFWSGGTRTEEMMDAYIEEC
ncbi:MAG: hypothetical protein IK079_03885 [Desulfovibrio sp.]|nr:hypothetical protein [Desulfovibrio sp.]